MFQGKYLWFVVDETSFVKSSMTHLFLSVYMCGVLKRIGIKNEVFIWAQVKQTFGLFRDHPTTIKKRFFSVFVVMLLSPFFVYFFSSPELFKQFTIWEVMGLRTEGLLSALVIPFLLTMILFLGPLSVQLTNGIWKIYSGSDDIVRFMHILTFFSCYF